MTDPTPGQKLAALWYMTAGPRSKRVTIERLTRCQVLTVDAAGELERWWRATGDQVGGAAHLMTTAAADRKMREWRAKEAQRRADATGRPTLIQETTT